MQVRVGSESMAFLQCGRHELAKTNNFLDALLHTQHRLILKQYFLACKLITYLMPSTDGVYTSSIDGISSLFCIGLVA
jgi:hypothetical protein